MPTYEYECQGCGHKFELVQSMTAKPIKECPKCRKNKAKRLISAGVGVIFKGSGFYATDYKRQKTEDRRQTPEKGKPKCEMAGEKKECSSCPGANPKND